MSEHQPGASAAECDCTECRDCIATFADEAEEFEDMFSAAHPYVNANRVAHQYRTRQWAYPISGDATAIRERFLR